MIKFLECGHVTFNENVRIVGGIPAVPFSWPAQVLISIKVTGYAYYGYYQYSYTDTFMCGGTIIDQQTILTAAHCIITTIPGYFFDYDVPDPFDPSHYTVYAGLTNDSFFINEDGAPSYPAVTLSVSNVIRVKYLSFKILA